MSLRKIPYIEIETDDEKLRFQVRLNKHDAEWLRKKAFRKDLAPATLISKIIGQVREKNLLPD